MKVKQKKFEKRIRYWSNKKLLQEDYLYRYSRTDGNDEESAWRLALNNELKRRTMSP
jgi:hypothetical protein